MTVSIFNDFFERIINNVYTGSDQKSLINKANSYLASNTLDTNSKKELLESSIDLAKNDIELYVRIMNLCVKNSLYCMNNIFLLSSLHLINKKYAGEIPSQDHNYQKMFDNVVMIIINHEILEEIDIIDSSETIIIGKDPRIRVPYQKLSLYKQKIFELLNLKYARKLLDTKFNFESNELINNIRKLNFIYTNFGKHIPFSSDCFCYSKINTDRYFQSDLSPQDYDEKMFDLGFFLFPLISEIKIVNEKIIVNNEGFGNLVDCDFKIVYPPEKKILYEIKINIECLKDKDIYIEKPVQNELSTLQRNDYLEFKFNFEKFEQRYVFSFKKQIGFIIEELKKGSDRMVLENCFNDNTNSFNNISGMFAPNSKNLTQNLVNNNINIEKLRGSYDKLAKLIDESDMESSMKEEAETNIKEIQEEISKDNWSVPKVLKSTDNLANLMGSFSKVLTYVKGIKDYLLDYIQ